MFVKVIFTTIIPVNFTYSRLQGWGFCTGYLGFSQFCQPEISFGSVWHTLNSKVIQCTHLIYCPMHTVCLRSSWRVHAGHYFSIQWEYYDFSPHILSRYFRFHQNSEIQCAILCDISMTTEQPLTSTVLSVSVCCKWRPGGSAKKQNKVPTFFRHRVLFEPSKNS